MGIVVCNLNLRKCNGKHSLVGFSAKTYPERQHPCTIRPSMDPPALTADKAAKGASLTASLVQPCSTCVARAACVPSVNEHPQAAKPNSLVDEANGMAKFRFCPPTALIPRDQSGDSFDSFTGVTNVSNYDVLGRVLRSFFRHVWSVHFTLPGCPAKHRPFVCSRTNHSQATKDGHRASTRGTTQFATPSQSLLPPCRRRWCRPGVVCWVGVSPRPRTGICSLGSNHFTRKYRGSASPSPSDAPPSPIFSGRSAFFC
jgi:hypothetical protein